MTDSLPKSGGEAEPFDNKDRDVLRHQADNSGRFHVRMWKSTVPLWKDWGTLSEMNNYSACALSRTFSGVHEH